MDCQFNTYSDETVRLFFQVLVHILMTKISVYTFYILFTQKLAKNQIFLITGQEICWDTLNSQNNVRLLGFGTRFENLF